MTPSWLHILTEGLRLGWEGAPFSAWGFPVSNHGWRRWFSPLGVWGHVAVVDKGCRVPERGRV